MENIGSMKLNSRKDNFSFVGLKIVAWFYINRNFRILFICVNIRRWERIFKFHFKNARVNDFWKFFEILSVRKRWRVFNEFGLNMLLFLPWNSISGYRSKSAIFWVFLFLWELPEFIPFDLISLIIRVQACDASSYFFVHIFSDSYDRYIIAFLSESFFGWFITLYTFKTLSQVT
jgi:hypothetical protein